MANGASNVLVGPLLGRSEEELWACMTNSTATPNCLMLMCRRGPFLKQKHFQAFLFRYRITKAGRLIDDCGRDLECDGYLEFYHYLDRSVGNCKLAEYRAHFCRGQLNNIVRVKDDPEGADFRVIYGLASYRIFALGAPSSFMSNTDEDAETREELRSIEPKLTLEQKLALSDPGDVMAGFHSGDVWTWSEAEFALW